MKHKEKYEVVYKTHDGVWNEMHFYNRKDAAFYKDALLNKFSCSEIKIFHYDLVDKIGQPRCVFDAEGLISLETAIEDVERISPHIF